MGAFDNRFWGVKRLNRSDHETHCPREQLEPYLDWRVIALEEQGILLCNPRSPKAAPQMKDLVIVEGSLIGDWLELHRSFVPDGTPAPDRVKRRKYADTQPLLDRGQQAASISLHKEVNHTQQKSVYLHSNLSQLFKPSPGRAVTEDSLDPEPLQEQ
jgi:hypothetical protein